MTASCNLDGRRGDDCWPECSPTSRPADRGGPPRLGSGRRCAILLPGDECAISGPLQQFADAFALHLFPAPTRPSVLLPLTLLLYLAVLRLYDLLEELLDARMVSSQGATGAASRTASSPSR